jgi:hypothetical protein
MGLLFTKVNDIKKTDNHHIYVHHGDNVHILDVGSRFFYPGDDAIELYYVNKDNVELSYDLKDRVVISTVDTMVHFIIIKGSDYGLNQNILKYPWLPEFNSIRITNLTENEYRNTREEVLSRYMFFRD